jgi:hypothetical protein
MNSRQPAEHYTPHTHPQSGTQEAGKAKACHVFHHSTNQSKVQENDNWQQYHQQQQQQHLLDCLHVLHDFSFAELELLVAQLACHLQVCSHQQQQQQQES